MHVHLPKPLHGWRAFAGEVGIIVLGVLIALAAEQLVEDWHWDQKVAVVRKSLMGELANDRARWEVDMAVARCMNREIDQLNRWAARNNPSAESAQSVPELAGGFFWMHSANWNLATGSQALDHFPMDDQLALAALYDGIAHDEVNLEGADDLAGQVRSVLPLADDAQGRRELRSALGKLRSKIAALIDNDGYMVRHFEAVGVTPDRRDFAADLANRNCKV